MTAGDGERGQAEVEKVNTGVAFSGQAFQLREPLNPYCSSITRLLLKGRHDGASRAELEM
jgi:hypothetical protein